MRAWGHFVAEYARLVITLATCLFFAGAAYGIGVFDDVIQGGFEDPESPALKHDKRVTELFGQVSADLSIAYSCKDKAATDPSCMASIADHISGLPKEHVTQVISHPATQMPNLISKDGEWSLVLVNLKGTSEDEKIAAYEHVRDSIASDDHKSVVTGQVVTFEGISETVESDLQRTELIALPIVFLISIFIFGSVTAAAMPVVVGAFAVVGAFTVVRMVTHFTDVSVFSINIITVLGMGLAVDYALFIVSRFREELAGNKQPTHDEKRRAVVATMETAGRTVSFSALLVAASLSALLIFPQPFLQSMGWGGIAAVMVAMLTAITVLPATLMMLGARIDFLSTPWTNRHRESDDGVWAKIARTVMRRPIALLLAATAVLAAIGSPILNAHWGGVDERVLPESSETRSNITFIRDQFGGQKGAATILLENVKPADLPGFVDDVKNVDGVENAAIIREDKATNSYLIEASWDGDVVGRDAQNIAKALRDMDKPTADVASVGGKPMLTVETIDSIIDRVPTMAAIVVAIMTVLLFFAFGSVILPFKAVLMSTISLSASFGAVAWVFSDGNLSGVLGFTPVGHLDLTQLILLLVVVFGLSMDYEVFLLSRVREEWDSTHNNVESVSRGMQLSGRIITSAAVLLAVVIGAFTTSEVQPMKQIGLGMFVAVLLDATLVRGVLVPATMRLLGAANWWAPAPLARFWEKYGHHEKASEPATVAVATVPRAPRHADTSRPEDGGIDFDAAYADEADAKAVREAQHAASHRRAHKKTWHVTNADSSQH